MLSVGVENLGLSPCATQELLEQLYSQFLTPELAKLVAQQTIKSWISNPQLAAESKSLFYKLGSHCDKSLYLEALQPTYELTTILIAEGHYKDLYIEIEARNRLNIPKYHIDDSSLKQMANDLREVHHLVTWKVKPKYYSNARSSNMRNHCYEDDINTRLNAMKAELHLGEMGEG